VSKIAIGHPAPLNEALLVRLSRGRHIPALNAVRGIAACLVVIAHTAGPVKLGGMAVSIFFVLSGFLITWLLLQESALKGNISLHSFCARRILRIFPAFYVFWIICIIAARLRRIPFSWGEAISSFFYLGDYYSALHASHLHQVMGITWSLGVEEKFYLLWPILFLVLWKDPPRLLKTTILLIALMWLYRTIACLTLTLPVDYLRYAFDSRLDNILYGCALALALRSLKLEPVLSVVDKIRLLPYGLAVLLVVLTVAERRLSDQFYYIAGLPSASIIVAVMLVQLIFLGALRGSSWLDHPFLQFLGLISYSLYLYHVVVISTVEHILPHLRLRWLYPLMLVASVGVAYGSYRLIERPFLSLKGHFASDRGHRPRPESPLPRCG
jgi:peptidoglycan/LPS O-acetylase OafA/YrhL